MNNFLKFLIDLFTVSGSQIFYNFAVGFGAIVGSLAGIKLIFDYLSQKKKREYVNEIKKLYPPRKLDLTFKIVHSPKLKGKLYLLDFLSKNRYWIQSSQTLTDLGFFWDSAGEITQEEFDKYMECCPLLTIGEPGT